jgi:hypothetical protein
LFDVAGGANGFGGASPNPGGENRKTAPGKGKIVMLSIAFVLPHLVPKDHNRFKV